jgi:ADP-heptose:LPS heptosyltransferase
LKSFLPLLRRHARTFWYVITVVLPVIIRTRTRPVIFSRFAGMGDIICTVPAALELKKRHPGAVFIYNCAASYAVLPRMAGVTERVTSFRDIGVVGHWYRRLLAGYYDFGSDDDDLTADHKELCITSFAKRQGVVVRGEHSQLQVDPAVVAGLKARLEKLVVAAGPLILVHPGPTWPVKQWPDELWSALVRELKSRGFANIFQLGVGVRNYTNLGAADAGTVVGAVSLVGKLSLEECIALISQADLFVGIDSGLLHAAASFRVPAVGIWGATSPKFYFPESEARGFVVSSAECQGCHHRVPRLHNMIGCPHDIQCMKTIGVGDVLSACLRILTPVKNRRTPD